MWSDVFFFFFTKIKKAEQNFCLSQYEKLHLVFDPDDLACMRICTQPEITSSTSAPSSMCVGVRTDQFPAAVLRKFTPSCLQTS